MANFEAQIEWTDGDGSKVSRTFYLVRVDRAAALTALYDLALNADNCTLGAITGVWLKEAVDFSAWGLKVTANGDREVKGMFKGRVTPDGMVAYPYLTSLPTFNPALTEPGGSIDITVNPVASFVVALVGSGFTDYRFTDIAIIDSAKERIG